MTSESKKDRNLLEAHRELGRHLSNLDALLEASGQDRSRLVEEIEQVRRHVFSHFDFEEAGGYLSEVVERDPNRQPLVESLQQQHDELRQSLDELLAATAELTLQELKSAIRSWIQHLLSHEARENRLVIETFDFDVGPGD